MIRQKAKGTGLTGTSESTWQENRCGDFREETVPELSWDENNWESLIKRVSQTAGRILFIIYI